jgi:hypothetical protein
MKAFRPILSVLLVLLLLVPTVPAFAATDSSENGNQRIVNNSIIIDDDATGGYEGDYVVIYNPSTSASASYSTGTMTGLIETTVEPNASTFPIQSALNPDMPIYKVDIDGKLRAQAQSEVQSVTPPQEPVKASYNVGDTKTFRILAQYSPTGSSSVSFECLYVGSHCYIWTPVSSSNNTYPLDEIDTSYAKLAADEFDSKFDLMQSSFGNHTNGSSGDGKLHMLYYNINEGWNGSGGYVAGFFYQVDLTNNGLPILNIDTYPGVYYKNPNSGNVYKRMDDTYGTMVHEYQHLINYSNTSSMSTWLNECFSAAAEEICYPGSSVVGRIQSWINYYYSDNNDWLNPPKEFEYQSSFNLHKGFSMYNWDNDIDDILALYSQVSFFAQYLFTRFGNTIYKQISSKYSSSETSAITNATGVSCADLVRDFRVAVTANAAQNQYNGVYGFKVQDGYDPTQYNNVENPWSLLAPVIFTGTSCSIKGGGAITVKPKNGVYNPPSGASSNLKYIGIKLASAYTITAVSNNDAWGTVSVDGIKITASPATGYCVSGYEVVSGTATATVSGNIITVTPESDCTIRVIFAPKPSYTVNFVAAGNNEGSQTAFDGDAITLPSSVSVNAEGWTFSGWTDTQISDETTAKPGYLLPGASYIVTANTTLYALYTRVEEGAGEVSYELVTNAPTDWTGSYVITYGTDTGMYVMKGVTPSSNGAQIENANNAAAYASAGVTLSGSVLSNVADAYVFSLAKHGSYYSIQSASTNAYVGMDASSYLAGYTTYASGSCDWTPGTQTNVTSATNANNGSYPLLSFSTNSNYFWSGSANTTAAKSVHWWKENGGNVTYYSTGPVAPHTHTYGEWTPNNDGTHSHTCAECGDTVTENCTYSDVVTAPTATEQGYTTHTCTVCGYTFTDSYVDALGYTVSFSVPNGVTAPAAVNCKAGASIMLPTAGAPAGYTFLGWVTEDVNNAAELPTVLTGSYSATADITLKALYSHVETTAAGFELVTEAPADWTGNYVITYGKTDAMTVLKGVSGTKKLEAASAGAAAAFANTGMTLDGTALNNVTDAYIFTIVSNGEKFAIRNASTGTFLANRGGYLYSYKTLTASYCLWTLAVNEGSVDAVNTASKTLSHLGFSAKNYFMMNRNADVELCFWKMGGTTSVTTYTTVID